MPQVKIRPKRAINAKAFYEAISSFTSFEVAANFVGGLEAASNISPQLKKLKGPLKLLMNHGSELIQ